MPIRETAKIHTEQSCSTLTATRRTLQGRTIPWVFRLFLLLASLLLLRVPGLAQAANFTFKLFPFVLIGGGGPKGINNHGLAVTDSLFVDTTTTPFRAITPQNPPPGLHFRAINDHNEAVGIAGGHGVLYANGTWTKLDFPGAIVTWPTGINNLGQVVGWYENNTGQHGFIYNRGTWVSFDFPDTTTFTEPAGINDRGQIVGDRGGHAIVYDHGGVTVIDYPGAAVTAAFGINNRGQVVGEYSTTSPFGIHGFLYDNGTFTTIDYPGAVVTAAFGINDLGQIVGEGQGGAVRLDYFLTQAPLSSSPKNLGDCAACMEGNPINAATGNKAQAETDFVGGSNLLLTLRRVYNSQDTVATSFGTGWRGTWHRVLKQVNPTTITATRASGRVETFTKTATGLWQSDPDVTSRLVAVTGGWRLTSADDSVEAYTPDGRLTSITTHDGITLTLTYDANKRLARVSDPFGHAMSFTYDASNRVNQMTAPGGGIYTYTYGANNNLASVLWPDGKVRKYIYDNPSYPNALTGIVDENGVRFATYAYNAAGQAITSQHAGGVDKTTVTYNANGTAGVTDPRGFLHTYTLKSEFGMVKPTAVTGVPAPNAGGKAFAYDPNGFLASRTDFNGNVTTYIHDARGNETSRTEAFSTPQVRTISTTWHPTLHVPTRITEPNRVTDITLDLRGNPKNVTVTAGGKTRSVASTYDAVGHVLTVDGARTDVTDVTTIIWGTDGNPKSVKNARGQITGFTWDAAGRTKTITDPNGLVTTFAYTPRGFLSSVTEGTELTRYDRDAVGQVTRITFPDGSFLAYSYDPAHRLNDISDALGNRIVYTLDAAGNIKKEDVRDPAQVLARTQSRAYDTVNRLAQIINAQGKITNFTYDPNGNLKRVLNPIGASTDMIYDALNRLTHIVDPNRFTTQQVWDANDNLTGVIDPRGLPTNYVFDLLGNKTAVQSPDTGTTSNNTFDDAGNVTSATGARGQITRTSYDALNRVTQQRFADGKTVTYRYDEGVKGIGHLTSMSDPSGSTVWKYDQHGRVIEKRQTVGSVTLAELMTYDAKGRLAALTYPSGKVIGYQYNAAGQVSGLTLNNVPVLSQIHYKPFGAADAWKIGNDGTIVRNFDLNGRITGYGVKGSANPTGDVAGLLYDDADRITDLGTTGQTPQKFGYDLRDQLTLFKAGTLTQAPTYDKNGNRLTQKTTRGAVATTDTYAIDPLSNRLLSTKVGTTTRALAHDATGNQTGDGTDAWLYDARNRLAQWSAATKRVDYLINGVGERVQKKGSIVTGGAVLFLYDGYRLLGEYSATGAPLQETVWLGTLPMMVLKPTASYFVTPDHRGAPHAITTATGRAVWTWNPDPFGTTAPNQNPAGAGIFVYNLRFPGQYFDAETGTHYNIVRDYNPFTGRYIQSDPIGLAGGLNTYGYVGEKRNCSISPGKQSMISPLLLKSG